MGKIIFVLLIYFSYVHCAKTRFSLSPLGNLTKSVKKILSFGLKDTVISSKRYSVSGVKDTVFWTKRYSVLSRNILSF